MTTKLFGDLVPHGRCDAAAQVKLVVRVPNFWILLDGLQQLSAIHEGILLGHDDRICFYSWRGDKGKGKGEGGDGVGGVGGDNSGRGAQLRPLTSIIGE